MPVSTAKSNIAVVHDWLPVFSGAEQVLKEIMLTVGPQDLYTLFDFLGDADHRQIGAKRIVTSYLDRFPLRDRYYRYTFPFCPAAIESFDLSDYDLVISSSAAFAKGVIVHPHQRHIAYVHTPARYAWDQTFEYLRRTPLSRLPFGPLLRKALFNLRLWDARTAHGPDILLANSTAVQRRIEQVYGRKSLVLAPPVDTDKFGFSPEKDDYFVVASRLVPYKRIDLVVAAFAQMPNRKLIVCGDGPEMSVLKSLAAPNVTFAGHLPRADLIRTIQRAKALVYAGYEDFGIVLAEAQSAGTPVIAYGRGGARDIVTPLGESRPTGHLFDEQTISSLIDGVETFVGRSHEISPEACRDRALLFSADKFRERLARIVDHALSPDFRRDSVIGLG